MRVPQGVEVQVLSRAPETAAEAQASAAVSEDGAYSLVVKLKFVELVSRVRFSLGTQQKEAWGLFRKSDSRFCLPM